MKRCAAWQATAGVCFAWIGLTLASGCGATAPPKNTRPEPPPFHPSIAVRCQMMPKSDGANLAGPLQSAIEQVIAEKERVSVSNDPATARLLLEVEFFLNQGSTNTNHRMNHRVRVVDTEHDVIVFEDVCNYLGTPHSESEAVTMVRSQFEKLANYFQKTTSASSQIELGAEGVAYLEGMERKDAQLNYYRSDQELGSQRVHVDYRFDQLGHGHEGAATLVAAGKVYDILEKHHFEAAPSAETAQFRIEVAGGAGPVKSYAMVFDGVAAPASSASGAALNATLRVYRANESEPVLELQAAGDPPPKEIRDHKSPQEIAAANLRKALGKQLDQLVAELKK